MPAKPQPIAAITKLITTSRPGVIARRDTGQREKARANNGAYAKANEAQRAECAVELDAIRGPAEFGDVLALK